MMSYSVYVHKNKHNGKVYVGLTSRKPHERWCNGSGYCSNKPFYNAIKKYGWDKGFEHHIIAEGLTADQAAELEKALIRHYSSNDSECGYNHTSGGFGYDGIANNIPRLRDLPKYSEIARDEFKMALFRELLSIAVGGRKHTETTERFDEHGNCIAREVTTHTTEPNIEVIEAIISNYGGEMLLAEEVAALKDICESMSKKEKRDV